ncbi:Signal transduction response regulator [Senna tora]|uniref:Signal transduction response regulator n=1 Tax=Senna tora TaxID=362788 RepID=A0A834T6L4_9FABA|nr:Signal transduction response regulator [Senna tora]
MVVKVASTCLQWSQPVLPHSPSSSQTLASAISSPSSKRGNRSNNGGGCGGGGALVCRFVHRLDRSSLLGSQSARLYRSRSCDYPGRKTRFTCSASSESFSDDEFSKKLEDLALRFHLSDEHNATDSESYCLSEDHAQTLNPMSKLNSIEPPWLEVPQEPPDWISGGDDEIIPPSIIERKANSVELPFSLRIIKKKLQWKEGFREAGESACCSVKKAFSSMVFIIRELHSYTLQMREILFYEDLQGILARVHKEMHASFVWLFQQVFSHTPTLMVYVMILLANFTVYSMGHNTAIAAAAAAAPPPTTEIASAGEIQKNQKFDSSAIKTFSVSSSSGKTTSIGGDNGGGGGKFRPIANGTDGGDGGFDRSEHYHRTVLPDGGASSQISSVGRTRGETESVSGEETRENEEKEAILWNSMVEEAKKMEGEGLDKETMERFVSPVTASIESDEDYGEYLRTELLYQTGLSQEPNNSLLLANYAQFLYLVAHDYDRAEEYFKRAIGVEGADAEAYNKYATFLWKAKKDLWGAEETYLEAISAEPTNSYYAANYAHFLWNTGAEDTCFPLSNSPDASQEL